MTTYKMIQIPPNVLIAAKGIFKGAPNPSQAAALYLERTVMEMAEQGWEFQRIDTIGVKSAPGCILSLFGFKSEDYLYYVITFHKP